MHLRELDLGLGANSGGEGAVADNVSESLSVELKSACFLSAFDCREIGSVNRGLRLREAALL